MTSPEWFGLDKNKLYATIFKGEQGIARDDEAYDHWRALFEKDGVPVKRIYEMGMKDNFWQMGDTGPCGPCSELHYDMGVEASDAGHTDCEFGCECGRYVEIWNLVFMQFDRQPDGEMRPLPKPSIDTGAGLERVAAVMQGVISNYDTDLFTPLIKRAAELTGSRSSRRRRRKTSSRATSRRPRCASSPTTQARQRSSSPMACCRRMKAAATCCARSSAARFGMDDCWDRRSRFCLRWCSPFAT